MSDLERALAEIERDDAAREYSGYEPNMQGDLDGHDEEHDVWGNRGEPKDIYGQKEEH